MKPDASRPDVSEILSRTTADELRGAIALAEEPSAAFSLPDNWDFRYVSLAELGAKKPKEPERKRPKPDDDDTDDEKPGVPKLPSPPFGRPASARKFAGHGFIFGAGGSTPQPIPPEPTRTAAEEVDTLAKAIMREQGITEAAARCQVFKDHDDLRLRFIAEANQARQQARR
jgi:hypothetical protein